MDEKIKMELDHDHETANLIIATAQFLSKCSPVGVEPKDWSVKLTPEYIREAADLVFLAMALIAERRA